MKSNQLTKLKLPDAPGIYIFRDVRKRPLYIGRATSLRNRVRSYFRADVIEGRGPRIVDMVTKSRTVTWETCDSILETILLEAELIKKYQPYYNIDERDDKSSLYVVITDEPWPRVFLARARDLDQQIKNDTLIKDKKLPFKMKKKFGPFPDSTLIKEALKILRRLFPFRDKKANDPRHEAFYQAIGQSPDRLLRDYGGDKEIARQNYLETIRYLILFFQGRKGSLEAQLKRQMKAYAKELRFEEADQAKKLLYALDHINDIALIKREAASIQFNNKKQFRMEAYDISHLGGSENVGAMVVSINGQPTPAEYRKFKISRNKNDDIAGLTEILSRRLNHSEWPYPDMIIVDGNKTHAKRAEEVLMSRRINIPVVAVTKDEHHKAETLVGSPDITKRYRREVIQLNAEAHRFTIKYHRARRGTIIPS
ncbi:MAG: GIY-YIG nuclease family protein [Candidatus Taylorbacteria bacterium]|nr:GIY-YIG nuclease family protein [Candidatus Taylorbacteria bacterium]